MRGIDYMSASSKKQLRKEQNAQIMTERQKKERAEQKKLKVMTVTFTIVILAIVVSFVATLAVNGFNRSGIVEKNTIALTVGDHKIDSVTMNYYFYDAISTEYNGVYNSYGDYTSYYYSSVGLDLTKPLDQQTYPNDSFATWADYYMDIAVKNATADYALYDAAMADESFQVPASVAESVDSNISTMELYAMLYYGFSDLNSYLRGVYGNGANQKNYREYTLVSATAQEYYTAHQNSLSYDDAAIRAYEETRFDNYSNYSFQSYTVNHTDFLTGGTTGEDGKVTYSEEEYEAARQAAYQASLVLLEATTVEELDAAIAGLEVFAEKETKPTSSLNADYAHTSLAEKYAQWLSSADRKAGDVTSFPNTTSTTNEDGTTTEVTNGYYVLMFISRDDNLRPLANVRHILFAFEGGTADANGNKTYSDEEKAAAKAEAEALLEQFLAGDTSDESFAALVHDNTDDTGSKETGGLYEDIYKGANYEKAFLDWSVDPARKAGDTGIVETSYGYHVMFYVSDDQLTNRDYMIKNDMLADDMETWYNGIVDAATATKGNFSKVNTDLIFSAS